MRPERREWEELAELDPLWAVLSDPTARAGAGSSTRSWPTGEAEVERTLARVAALGLPERRERALDFGCGVGRITRALASRFGEVVGLDASRTMVEHARRINAAVANASFVAGSLADLEPGSFDLAWSVLVLQHLAPDEVEPAIERLVELVRPARRRGLPASARDEAAAPAPALAPRLPAAARARAERGDDPPPHAADPDADDRAAAGARRGGGRARRRARRRGRAVRGRRRAHAEHALRRPRGDPRAPDAAGGGGRARAARPRRRSPPYLGLLARARRRGSRQTR